jgi:hypothetical protein
MQRLLMETLAGLTENPATAQRIQASAMRPDWIDRGVRAWPGKTRDWKSR